MENEKIIENRYHMIENQIKKRGITNTHLLNAMSETPREEYVPLDKQDFAYWDGPLGIGHGQTISQPYVVAYMIDKLELKNTDKVLEIGTGSGYNAALMSRLAKEVHTLEVVPELFEKAQSKLENLENIFIYSRDGFKGVPEKAPFDKIILTAAPASFPDQLWEQLAEGGIMIAPIGSHHETQELFRYKKIEGQCQEEFLLPVRFVPMIS